MAPKGRKPGFALVMVIVSFLAAFLLTILPLPSWAEYFRPPWVVMTLFYWILTMPGEFGFGMAFLFGLLLDVLVGANLGLHTQAILLVCYPLAFYQRHIALYSWRQQTCFVFGLLLFYQFMVSLGHFILGSAAMWLRVPLSALVGSLLWPWLIVVLRDYRQNFCE